MLDVLHSERSADKAPAEVHATLLEKGIYLRAIRTMYRILAEADEVRERRNQLRHPGYTKPEPLASGSNQVWSWDITKLKGPAKWTYSYLKPSSTLRPLRRGLDGRAPRVGETGRKVYPQREPRTLNGSHALIGDDAGDCWSTRLKRGGIVRQVR